MKKRISLFVTGLLISAVVFTSCVISNSQDSDASAKKFDAVELANVENAIKDYVEGIYLVDSTRIERSVDSTMRKIGYWYNPKKKEYMDNLPMTYKQLVRLAARWNKDGKRADASSPKEIEIYDINSKSASAKLTAVWGIDYFHLSKVNGQWKIMNVLWQSMPDTED